MRHSFARLIFAAVLTAVFSASLLAQNGPTAKAAPDLSGIWEMINQVGPGGFILTDQPSMLPWAQQVYDKFRQGTETTTERTLDEGDPILIPYCMPHGFPRIFSHTPPFEIVQTSNGNVIYLLFEANNQRMSIYMDGRKHTDDAPRTFFGHSTGRWDGDTLVVETVHLEGLGGYSRIDALGHPHTDALRVEWRIRRVDRETLEMDFLFDDPKAYARPWSGKKIFKLRTGWELMDYNICQQEQKERYLDHMGGPRQGM